MISIPKKKSGNAKNSEATSFGETSAVVVKDSDSYQTNTVIGLLMTMVLYCKEQCGGRLLLECPI